MWEPNVYKSLQQYINVNPTNQGMHLTITASSETDPIRNIRVIMPGFANDYQTQPFYPPILNYIDSADVLGHINFYGELLILPSKNCSVKFVIY